MSQQVTSGRIEVHDIEELNYCVSPWELDMRQISGGKFHALLNFVQINGMLLSRERWSQRVRASGVSPRDYLAVAGPCTKRSFQWRGTEINSQRVLGGSGTNTDFLTPVGSDHWVILVPKDLLISKLGAESASAALRRRRPIQCGSKLTRQLFTLVDRTIDQFRTEGDLPTDDLMIDDIESELMNTIAKVFVEIDTGRDCTTPRSRYFACCRAISCAEDLQSPIRVPELAAAVGVSQRVLELGFKETLGISPQRYLRWCRLNHLHRELRGAQPELATVTETALRWGFSELGRAAVEYRRLFGESPSTTLRRDRRLPGIRYADALSEPLSDFALSCCRKGSSTT